MAKTPKTQTKVKSSNSAGKTWFKNAASAFKYTSVEIGSEHMPFIVGTVTNTINAIGDLRNWVKTSTPFRSSPGGNTQEKKAYKVASNLVKAGFNDIKTGKLAFDGLNTEIGKLLEGATGGDSFDDWGDNESAFDFDASLTNDTYLSGVEINTKANVEAIGQSTDILANTTAKGLDLLAKRNQVNSVIMTSRLAEQLIQGNRITTAINNNLMSLVEQNNEASSFRQQQQQFMENTEQNLNDIKEILNNMADMTSQMVPKERNRYGSSKVDFISGGFNIKEYGKHILNDSLLGTFAQLILPSAAPFLSLLGFDTSGIETFGMGGGLKINPLAEIMKRTKTVKDLSKFSSRLENYTKMFLSNLNARNDMLGVVSTFLGLGIDNPVTFRDRPSMGSMKYGEGIARWEMKDQRTLREVIPGYLSKIEANTSILAQNIAKLQGADYLDAVANNTRFFDEEDGVFKGYQAFADDLQSSLNSAATSAASEFTDMLSKVINGSDSTKQSVASLLEGFFNREGFISAEDIKKIGSIVKYNLATVADDDNSKEAKLIRRIKGSDSEYINFVRTLVDALDQGKINLISERERIFNDVGARTNAAFRVLDDRSGLTKSPYDAVISDDPKKAKQRGLHYKYDARYVTSEKELQKMLADERFADMTDEERQAYQNQQRQSDAIEGLGTKAKNKFKKTWLGKKVSGLVEKLNNFEVTKDIKNSDINLALNPLSNLISGGLHGYKYKDLLNDVTEEMIENAQPMRRRKFRVVARNAVSNAENAAEGAGRHRVKIRRRQNNSQNIGNVSDYENSDYNNAQNIEDAREAREQEMADNIRDMASANAEQNTRLFGKDGVLTQMLNNTVVGKLASKAKGYLAGEKNDNGYYEGGALSDVANFGVDNKRGIQHIFTGKGYVDSQGNTIEETDDAVFKHIGRGANAARTNILKRYLGEDYRESSMYTGLPNFLKDKEDRSTPNGRRGRKVRPTRVNPNSITDSDDDYDIEFTFIDDDEFEDNETGSVSATTSNPKPQRQANDDGEIHDNENVNPILGSINTDKGKVDINRDQYQDIQSQFASFPSVPASIEINGKTHCISPEEFSSFTNSINTDADLDLTSGSEEANEKAKKEKKTAQFLKDLRSQFRKKDVNKGYAYQDGTWYEVDREHYEKMMQQYEEKYGELDPSSIQDEINESVATINERVKKVAPIAITGAIAGSAVGLAAHGGVIPAVLGVGGPIGAIIAGTGIALATRSNTFMEKVFGKDDGKGEKVGGIISDKFQKTVKKKMPWIVAGGTLGALKGLLLPSVATSGIGLIPATMFGGVLGPAILGIGTSLLLSSEKLKETIFGKDNGDGTRSGGPLSKFTSKTNQEIRKRILKQIGGGAAGAGIGAFLGATATSGLPSLLGPIGMGVAGLGLGITAMSPKFNEAIFGTKNIDKNGKVIGRNKDGLIDKLGNYIKINIVNPIGIWAKHMFGEIGSYFRDNIKDNLSVIFSALKRPFEDIAGSVRDFIASIGSKITKGLKLIFSPFAKLTGALAKGILKGGMDIFGLGTRMIGSVVAAPLNLGAFIANAGTMIKHPGDIVDMVKYRASGIGQSIKENGFFKGLSSSLTRESALKNRAEWAAKSGNDVYKAAAQKALDRFDTSNRRKEDKAQTKLSNKITGWARTDNYDETVSLDKKTLNRRKKYIGQMTGLDTKDWTQQDIKNFMYSSEVRSGKYNEFKTVAQQEQARAAKEKEKEKKEDKARDDISSINQGVTTLHEDISEATDAIIRTMNGQDITVGRYAKSDDIDNDNNKNDKTKLGELEDQEKEKKAEAKRKKIAVKVKRDAREAEEDAKAHALAESNNPSDDSESEDDTEDSIDENTKKSKFKEFLTGNSSIGSQILSGVNKAGRIIGAIGLPILAISAIRNPKMIVDLISKIPAVISSLVQGIGTLASGIGTIVDKVGEFIKGSGKYVFGSGASGLLWSGGQITTGDSLADSAATTLFGADDRTESRSKTGVDAYGNEYAIKNGHLTGSIKNLFSRLIRRGFHADFKTGVKTGLDYGLKKMRSNIGQVIVNKIDGKTISNLAFQSPLKYERLISSATETAASEAIESATKMSARAATESTLGIVEDALKSGTTASFGLQFADDVVEATTRSATVNGARLVAETAETTAKSNFSKIWTTFTDAVKGAMEKHAKKGVTNAATTAVVQELTDIPTKKASKLKQLISKYANKINKAWAQSAQEAAAKTTTPIGWAITGICAAWDATTGALDAANLFYVREEDVDWKMRVISSILKTLIGLSLIASLIDVVNEILAELLGFDFKSWLATTIYHVMSDEEDDIKLDKAQMQFRTDLEDYNAKNGTNLTLKTYNEKENAKTGIKIWNSIKSVFDKNKSGNGVSTRSTVSINTTSIESQAANGNLGYGNLRNNSNGSGNQYSQEDSRWKNVSFGKTNSGMTTTIGTGGCGPTALANVYRNITGRKDITPTTVANMAVNNGYTTNGGSNEGLFTEGATQLGLSSERINPNEIAGRLMSGQSVIMSGVKRGTNSPYTSSGHIISASGISNGKVIVNDPLKSNSTLTSLNDVMSGINKAWAIDGSGGYGKLMYNLMNMGYGPFTYESATNKFIPTNSYQLDRMNFNVPFGSTALNPSGDSSIYYSQLDDEWSGKSVNAGTVGNIGCLLTSFAMAMNALTGGIDFDPGSLATMFPGDKNGVLASEANEMASLIKANYHRINISGANSDQYAADLETARTNIKAILNAGYPVIISGTTAGVTYDNMTKYKSPEFFPSGTKALASFIDGSSSGKNSGHHVMLLGSNHDDKFFKTYLFNPGRSISGKNPENKGVKLVDLDGAIDNYKSMDPKFGTLTAYRYFDRDSSLNTQSSAELWRNLQEYFGITADGDVDTSSAESHPMRSSRAATILQYFKDHGVTNVSDIKKFVKNADKLSTAALAGDEVKSIQSGSTTPSNITSAAGSEYTPTFDAASDTSSTNDDGTQKSKLERVAEILGQFTQIGVNMLSAVLSGDPKSYKSIFDGNYTYKQSKWYDDQQPMTTDTGKYVYFGNDVNGNPIVVSASNQKQFIYSDAVNQLTDDYLARYEAKMKNPKNAADAAIWANYLKYRNAARNGDTIEVPDGEHNYYQEAMNAATEYAKKTAEAKMTEASTSGIYYTIDENGNIVNTATVSGSNATSNATIHTANSITSYPDWATRMSGKYGINGSSFTAKSTKFTNEQLADMSVWLSKSIAAHETGFKDSMTADEADHSYFNPLNLPNEDATTFGIGGFKGPNAAEVMARLAQSGNLSSADASAAQIWADKLASRRLSNSELESFRNFIRKDGVREHLKVVEHAYHSQLVGSYINRAAKYYDNGKIKDPRSVLLGAELYPLSGIANFYSDLPNTTVGNELTSVRDNIISHMKKWRGWSGNPGWNRRIWNDYHMLVNKSGIGGQTPSGENDSFGITNPTPASVANSIPSGAEGYGDLKNAFKSYSTYKSSYTTKLPRVSESGSSSIGRSMSITSNRSYTPSVIQKSEGFGPGVDMKPMENKTDRVISLLEKVASNTGRRNTEERTTINNYNTTNNNSSVGYGDLNMGSDGKSNTIVVNGKQKSATDYQHSDTLRKLHERIARSPRH